MKIPVLGMILTSLFLTACGSVSRQPLIPEATFPLLNVQFAGFAYMGDDRSIKENYPLTVAINKVDNDGQSLVDRIIKQQLAGINPKYFNLSNNLALLEANETVAMALVLDRETAVISNIDSQYKLLVELGFQVLFFDFQEMHIIGAYPITLQYNDILERHPSNKEIKAIVKGALIGDFGGMAFSNNIYQEVRKLLLNLKVNKKQGNHLQVTTVNIEERAKRSLPKQLQKERNAKNYVAQSFSKYLSLNQRVSVLPYTKDYAIGNRMSARFSNGDVFNLMLPEPDYSVGITLRGFKKKLYDQVGSAKSIIYGVYFSLKIFEPLTEKRYLDSSFVQAGTVIVSDKTLHIEDWPIYDDLILSFFDGLTKEISSPSLSWVKKHSKNAMLLKEMNSFRSVVERCK